MKNKGFYAVLLAAIMVLVSGCGKQAGTNDDIKEAAADVENITVQDDAETAGTDSDSIGSEGSDVTSGEAHESNPVVTEKDDSELHMKDYHDYLEDKTLLTEDNVFDGMVFDVASQ